MGIGEEMFLQVQVALPTVFFSPVIGDDIGACSSQTHILK